jgi:chromosome segregation ATPase
MSDQEPSAQKKGAVESEKKLRKREKRLAERLQEAEVAQSRAQERLQRAAARVQKRKARVQRLEERLATVRRQLGEPDPEQPETQLEEARQDAFQQVAYQLADNVPPIASADATESQPSAYQWADNI